MSLQSFIQQSVSRHNVTAYNIYFILFNFLLKASFSKSTNNTRILNNLYGFIALDGIYISMHKFIHLVLIDYFSEENPMMCLLDVNRIYMVSLTNLIISMISAATLLRHFFPQIYLDLSEKWRNKTFGIFIMSVSGLHLFWSGKSCGLCQKECIFNKLVLILKVSVPLSLMVVICVTIDSVLGFAKIFNRVRNFICKNEITPVNQFHEAPTLTIKVS